MAMMYELVLTLAPYCARYEPVAVHYHPAAATETTAVVSVMDSGFMKPNGRLWKLPVTVDYVLAGRCRQGGDAAGRMVAERTVVVGRYDSFRQCMRVVAAVGDHPEVTAICRVGRRKS
jgi:hypothetical protein